MTHENAVQGAWAALRQGRFIKPIAGAAMGDPTKIERWALIHSAAGASALDVRWEPRCVAAARRGRDQARQRLGEQSGWPVIMASITPEGDVHTLKAKLEPDRCAPCPACQTVCPDDALKLPADGPVEYFYDRCRGCDRCVEACPTGALSMIKIKEGEFRPRLRASLSAGAESVEVHASDLPDHELDQVLRDLDAEVDNDVLVSICLGSLQKPMREVYGSIEVIRERRRGRPTMIQADGKTMGSRPGGLVALGLAELIIDARLPNTWVVASGGVTPLAWRIAELTGLEIGGIGLGIESYRVIADFVNDDRLTSDDALLLEAADAARGLHRSAAAHVEGKLSKGPRFQGPAAAKIGGRTMGRRRGSKADDEAFSGPNGTSFGGEQTGDAS